MNPIPPARRIFRRLCSLKLILGLCCWLLAVGTALAAPSQGRIGAPEISRIEALIAEAEFESALSRANAALARPGNSPDEVGRLYELQGMLYLYLGDESSALRSFRRLLDASPQYRLREDASPKVLTLFEEAREQMAVELSQQLKLAHPRPRPAQPGVPIEIEIRLDAPPQGVQAKLFYRRTARAGFSSTRFVESDDSSRWVAHVPDLELSAHPEDVLPSGALEYFIEVQDPTGSLLAIAGKREAPLVVPLATAAEQAAAGAAAGGSGSAWYQKWWVWTIVGVVVAGAVTGGVVYALSSQTGTVPVTVTLQ